MPVSRKRSDRSARKAPVQAQPPGPGAVPARDLGAVLAGLGIALVLAVVWIVLVPAKAFNTGLHASLAGVVAGGLFACRRLPPRIRGRRLRAAVTWGLDSLASLLALVALWALAGLLGA